MPPRRPRAAREKTVAATAARATTPPTTPPIMAPVRDGEAAPGAAAAPALFDRPPAVAEVEAVAEVA